MTTLCFIAAILSALVGSDLIDDRSDAHTLSLCVEMTQHCNTTMLLFLFHRQCVCRFSHWSSGKQLRRGFSRHSSAVGSNFSASLRLSAFFVIRK